MANLHPKTLTAIAEYFASGNSVPIMSRPMSREVIKRIAQIAMEEEREECATICNLLRPLQKGDKGTEYELIRTDAFADAEEAIRRRGKP